MFAVKRRVMRLQERASAIETNERSPAAAMGMAVNADIAPALQPRYQQVRMRAKVSGCIDLAAAPSGQDHTGWRRPRRLRVRLLAHPPHTRACACDQQTASVHAVL